MCTCTHTPRTLVGSGNQETAHHLLPEISRLLLHVLAHVCPVSTSPASFSSLQNRTCRAHRVTGMLGGVGTCVTVVCKPVSALQVVLTLIPSSSPGLILRRQRRYPCRSEHGAPSTCETTWVAGYPPPFLGQGAPSRLPAALPPPPEVRVEVLVA